MRYGYSRCRSGGFWAGTPTWIWTRAWSQARVWIWVGASLAPLSLTGSGCGREADDAQQPPAASNVAPPSPAGRSGAVPNAFRPPDIDVERDRVPGVPPVWLGEGPPPPLPEYLQNDPIALRAYEDAVRAYEKKTGKKMPRQPASTQPETGGSEGEGEPSGEGSGAS